MDNKRNRYRRQTTTLGPNKLRDMYLTAINGKTVCNVSRQGDHPLLRWLVRCASCAKRGKQRDDIIQHVNQVSATFPDLLPRELDDLEADVACYVMSHTADQAIIQYFAAFFRMIGIHYKCINLPCRAVSNLANVSWLSPVYTERSLVVPDIRKASVDIAMKACLRPGEMQYAAAMDTSGVCNETTALRMLRPIEYTSHVRHTLSYGTMQQIYDNGLLDYVHLAMVNSKAMGRLNMDWIQHVMVFPSMVHSDISATFAFPRVLCRGMVMVWTGRQTPCRDARSAFVAWCTLAAAHATNGLVNGRWDISKLTI